MRLSGSQFLLCLPLITLSFVFLLPGTVLAQGWHIEVVDSDERGVGRFNSLALDSNGYPAISYFVGTNLDLKFARWNGSSWDFEIVDSEGNLGRHTSLELDSNGYPAISYQDVTNWHTSDKELKFARWNGSSWDIEVVDPDSDVGEDTSLELDSNGYPAISYYDDTNHDLKFARWNGFSWDIEVVEPDVTDTIHLNSASLALDSNGYPAISYLYVDGTIVALKFARWNGFSWDIEIVDSQGSVGGNSSLALDSNGYPAIAYEYNDTSNATLKFARWNGSSWDIEVVTSDGKNGYWPSLELDSNDYPAISLYYSLSPLSSPALGFVRWNGSSWDFEVVDSGRIGFYNSLELDSNDYPAISYYDNGNDDLKFARYEGAPDRVFRGCVNTALSDWKSTWLPLTGDTDDEAPPFPVITSIPGEVFDDNFPCQEASADLLLYRVLIGGSAPAGNILRAEKVPSGVKLSF